MIDEGGGGIGRFWWLIDKVEDCVVLGRGVYEIWVV